MMPETERSAGTSPGTLRLAAMLANPARAVDIASLEPADLAAAAALLEKQKENLVAAGGAIVAAAGEDSGTITLSDMTIESNDADYGGGIMVNENADTQARVFLNGVTVRDNRA